MTASTGAPDVLQPILERVPALGLLLRRFPKATQLARDVVMLASGVAGPPRAVSTVYGRRANGSAVPGERRLRVLAVRQETPRAVSIDLERPRDVELLAGQFLTLVLLIDGREVRRSYSVSSSPADESKLTITVKKIEGGVGSSWIHDHVKPGQTLRVRGPSGNFTFTPDCADELLLVGGGSGITPLMSILRDALATRSTRAHLVFANTSEDEVIFSRELDHLAQQYADRLTITHVIERPGVRACVDGRVTPELVAEAWKQLSTNARAYVCGPDGLMDLATAALREAGAASSQVFVERFASLRVGESFLNTVPRRLEVMGQSTIVAPGKTLLDAATQAGINLDFSCTMGGCGACKARLLSGDVSHDEPNCLSSQEREAGMILTCVARPVSDVSIERLS